MTGLPPYYFRLRDVGAHVFRVAYDERNQRIEMEPIASVQIRNGDIRPLGDRNLTASDRAAIAEWLAARQGALRNRDREEVERSIEALNATAHWAQTRATPEDLDAVTDRLLLAMHDLRGVLARKRAELLAKDPPD